MRGERRRRRPRRRRFKLIWIYIEIAALLVLAILIGSVGGAFYSVAKMLPSGLDVAGYEPTEATKIISSDGVVLAEVFEENREVVSISDIPKDLQNATVAIEDERFFKHPGVDIRGIVRAMYRNLLTGRIAQGGSTLTQQLARNIYLTREKKLSRKLKEILLALELERNYSKEQILELYLNQVYYGSGSYGVQTASRVYFDKDVKDLTLAECALLAGLTQKPSAYSPYEDLDAALKRRDVVLNRMAELGYITSAQCEDAKADEPHLVGLKPTGLAKYKAPWFVTYVIKGLTEEYGADLVYRGGLRVHTTLNYEMQQIAERELRDHVAKARSQDVSQGALVCIDPHTGQIKAMVGGVNPDFPKDQFNRAVQARRQPGSAFKAFVYTAAIDGGYDPNYRVSNAPISYKGKPWPNNYSSRQRRASYSMKQAVAESVNRCAVNMALKIGIDKVITYARMLGIKSPLGSNASLALGASVVTPLELCSAYGVFAADGMRAEPTSVVRIAESDGNREGAIIEENALITRQVISQQTAELMNELFRAVVVAPGGTGYAARRIPNAHGKTGTTQNDRDAWFVGYTPELVTAVWVGNDNYSPMRHVWGGNVCAPTWTEFMLKALEIHKRESHPEKPAPDSLLEKGKSTDERKPRRSDSEGAPGTTPKRRMITICTESGFLATGACPSTREIPYEAGSEALATCPLHKPETGEPSTETPSPGQTPSPQTPRQPTSGPVRPGTVPRAGDKYISVTICVDSGQIANMYCPETITRRFLASEAPTKVCRTHRPPSQ